MTRQIRLPRLVLVLVASVVMALGMTSLALAADESQAARSSTSVTWTCTSSPCPSGPLFEGHAGEWPSAMGATNVRLGYTASRPVYAPGAAAKGWTVVVLAGSARVEAGLPQDAAHRQLATLGAGGSYVVGELGPGEVVSVQAGSVFMYELLAPAAPSPTSTTTSTTTTQSPTSTTSTTSSSTTSTTTSSSTTSSSTTTSAPTSATSTTTTQAPSPTSSPATGQVVNGSSALQTWTCTGSPCPWGPTSTDHALAWPSAMGALNVRLGYTVSAGVYAPAASVQGRTVTVTSGSARVYAGLPQGSSHRLLASLSAGGSYLVGTLGTGEVVSVQNATAFSWSLTALAEPTPSPTTTTTPTTTTATSTPTTTTTTSTPTTTTTTSTPTTTTTTTVPEPSNPGTVTGSSSLVTWTCAGSPCPWGPTTTDHALVWPAGLGATNVRLGYTASAALYVPGSAVSGSTVTVTSGSARVYAGLPQGSSHRLLATLSAGGSYVVGALGTGEVLSVQNSTAFSWSLTAATGSTPTPTTTTTSTPTPTTTTTTPTPTPTTTTPPPGVPEGSTASSLVTWTCTSSPCPWGPSTSDHALVWPSTMGASTARLGYTASAGVYAPAAAVAGWTVSVPAGTARVYAGLPQGSSHRLLATIVTGGSHVISGLSSGEVVSVQAVSDFAWTLTEPVGGPTPTPTGTTTTPTPTGTTTPPPTTACTDPTTCDPVDWIESRWRCNVPDCTYGDWVGGVISWPSWAAYSTNARSGASSRTVYSVDGELLHPYMGSWASGCRVTVVSGAALIIEWKRGSDTWRETLVEEGESHVIQLAAGEDGAMIETPNNVEPFSVTLQNCTPQPVTQPSP